MFSLTKAIKKFNYGKHILEIIPLSEKLDIKEDREIISPLLNWRYAGIIGTAYDYLLRFYLYWKFKNNKKIHIYSGTSYWKDKDLKNDTKKFLETLICYKGLKALKVTDIEKFNKIQKEFNNAINTINNLISNKEWKITNNELEAIILISNLDTVFRSKVVNQFDNDNWKKAIDIQIQDLNNLTNNLKYFPIENVEKNIHLNQTIGSINKYISSSDCDIIIDDLLIDIKTVKNLDFSKNDFSQLLGYYFGCIEKKIKIKKIAIYYSRFNYLHIIDLKELNIDNSKIETINNNWIAEIKVKLPINTIL